MPPACSLSATLLFVPLFPVLPLALFAAVAHALAALARAELATWRRQRLAREAVAQVGVPPPGQRWRAPHVPLVRLEQGIVRVFVPQALARDLWVLHERIEQLWLARDAVVHLQQLLQRRNNILVGALAGMWLHWRAPGRLTPVRTFIAFSHWCEHRLQKVLDAPRALYCAADLVHHVRRPRLRIAVVLHLASILGMCSFTRGNHTGTKATKLTKVCANAALCVCRHGALTRWTALHAGAECAPQSQVDLTR